MSHCMHELRLMSVLTVALQKVFIFMPLMYLVCMKARPADMTHLTEPTIPDCMVPSSCIAVTSFFTSHFSAMESKGNVFNLWCAMTCKS